MFLSDDAVRSPPRRHRFQQLDSQVRRRNGPRKPDLSGHCSHRPELAGRPAGHVGSGHLRHPAGPGQRLGADASLDPRHYAGPEDVRPGDHGIRGQWRRADPPYRAVRRPGRRCPGALQRSAGNRVGALRREWRARCEDQGRRRGRLRWTGARCCGAARNGVPDLGEIRDGGAWREERRRLGQQAGQLRRRHCQTGRYRRRRR